MPLFYTFSFKLQRANEHLQSSKRLIDDWIATKPYSFTDKFDPKRGFHVVTFKRVSSTRDNLSPIIGDCLHNLRSSLDHSVFALTQIFQKRQLPSSILRKTQFPIFCDFHTSSEFMEKAKSKIGHIHPGAQAAIESLQPYHAGKRSNLHPLWLLNELDIIDKHRAFIGVAELHPTLTVMSRSRQSGSIIRPTFARFFGIDSDKSEAEVFHYGLPEGHPRMDMDFDSAVKITFADGPAKGQEIVKTLSCILKFLTVNVFPKITPFFTLP